MKGCIGASDLAVGENLGNDQRSRGFRGVPISDDDRRRTIGYLGGIAGRDGPRCNEGWSKLAQRLDS